MTARTYQRRIAALREIIVSAQWVQPTYNGSPSCSGCAAQQHQGCSLGCPVATVTGDWGARQTATDDGEVAK